MDGIIVPVASMTIIGGRVRISSNGFSVRVETDFGLGFDYNSWNYDLKVYAPKSLQNQVSGLCGRYDGNAGNDLVDRNGVDRRGSADGQTIFGNSWQVNDPENPS